MQPGEGFADDTVSILIEVPEIDYRLPIEKLKAFIEAECRCWRFPARWLLPDHRQSSAGIRHCWNKGRA